MISQTVGGDKDQMTGYPSIDKPWLKYYPAEVLSVKPNECTVYQNVYENNKDHLKDVAIRYFGHDITYREVFRNVARCAKSLKQIGIKKGDCVTLCTAGVPEAIYLVLACSRIGAIANFLNPLFTTEQMIDLINDTEAEWIFVLDEMFSYIEEALPHTCIKKSVIIPVSQSMPWLLGKAAYMKGKSREILKRKIPYQLVVWSEFLKLGAGHKGRIGVPYEKDLPTVMVYSSGSTGASKGILLTNDGINATIAHYQTEAFPAYRGETFLQMIPVWFSTGIVLSVLMPLSQGIIVIPELQFSKEKFVEDMLKYKPNITLAATSLWVYAINSDEMKSADLSTLKYPVTGGEKVLPKDEESIKLLFEKHGCNQEMIKGYGMCELGSTITSSTASKNYIPKPGGNGYPIINAVVAAFEPKTNQELKYNERGEIRVLSPARMKGYYKNPTATEQFFKTDKDGNVWGCTGDIGYVDEDGEVFILGRATDSYELPDGRRVYLFDTEEIINRDINVATSKVVDIEEDGAKVLVAHIALRDRTGADVNSILKRIHESCKTALPEYSVPKYYKVRESFPVHSNGKRDVEMIRADREELIHIE